MSSWIQNVELLKIFAGFDEQFEDFWARKSD